MTENVQWAKIRPAKGLSYHIFLTFTRVPGLGRAVCGRNLDAATLREDRPGHGKTCESCLRIAGPR